MGTPIVMVNGLPGKMATIIAQGILNAGEHYILEGSSLTGPGQPNATVIRQGEKVKTINLYRPEQHEEIFSSLALANKASGNPLYVIDFCKGENVAVTNAQRYFKERIPFVMGSTIMGMPASEGYELIHNLATESNTPCVVAPNFDERLNAWMAGLVHMAEKYPRAFKESLIEMSETHQADKVYPDGKPETSGTMKKMLAGLSALGDRKLTIEDILSIRDPAIQQKLMGVPTAWLGWHAYHIIKVYNEHDGVQDSEELIFKRHGGECYRRGAMKALDFLIQRKYKKPFNTMVDVMQA